MPRAQPKPAAHKARCPPNTAYKPDSPLWSTLQKIQFLAANSVPHPTRRARLLIPKFGRHLGCAKLWVQYLIWRTPGVPPGFSSHPPEQLRWVNGAWGTTKGGQGMMQTSSGFQDQPQKKPSQGQVLSITDVGLGCLPRVQTAPRGTRKIKIVNHYGCLSSTTSYARDVPSHSQRRGALVKRILNQGPPGGSVGRASDS